MAAAEGPGDLSRSTSERFLFKQTSVQCFLMVSSPTGQNYPQKTTPSVVSPSPSFASVSLTLYFSRPSRERLFGFV